MRKRILFIYLGAALGSTIAYFAAHVSISSAITGFFASAAMVQTIMIILETRMSK